MASPGQAMNASFNPFHLVNTYGAFGSVGRERYEVIVEGTVGDHLDADDGVARIRVQGQARRRPPRRRRSPRTTFGWTGMIWFIPLSPAYASGLVRPVPRPAAPGRSRRSFGCWAATRSRTGRRGSFGRGSSTTASRPGPSGADRAPGGSRTFVGDLVPPFGLGTSPARTAADEPARRCRRRERAEWPRGGDHARPGRAGRHGARGAPTAGRWDADRRVDAARLPPRRVQRDPPVRPDVAVLRRRRPRPARAAVDPAADLDGPPARRRHRGPRPARRRGDRGRAWRGRATRTGGCSAPLVRRLDRPAPRPPRPVPRPAHRHAHVADGALRAARAPAPRRGSARRFRGDVPGPCSPGAAAHSILAADGAGQRGGGPARCWRRHMPTAGRSRRAAPGECTRAGGGARSRGGRIETGQRVGAVDDLPGHRVAVFDIVAPRSWRRIAGDRLPAGYRRRLERFRHGPGVFKLDLAMDGPIPWQAPELGRASTVHLGGTLRGDRPLRGPRQTPAGPDRPFVLLAQQSLFDPSRAPRRPAHGLGLLPRPERLAGRHDANRSSARSSGSRRLPGADPRARRRWGRPSSRPTTRTTSAATSAAAGSISASSSPGRPCGSSIPYSTPDPSMFLWSASTPPGGGVHGMCGYHAARSVERRLR